MEKSVPQSALLFVPDISGFTQFITNGEGCAAKILGLNATTLEARMKKLGIKRG